MTAYFGLIYEVSSGKYRSLLTNDELAVLCAKDEYRLPDGGIDVPLSGGFVLSKLQVSNGFTISLLSGGKITIVPLLRGKDIENFLLHGEGTLKNSFFSNTTTNTLDKITKEADTMKIEVGGDLGVYDNYDTELNDVDLIQDANNNISFHDDTSLLEMEEPLPFAIDDDEYVSLL